MAIGNGFVAFDPGFRSWLSILAFDPDFRSWLCEVCPQKLWKFSSRATRGMPP